MPMSSDFTPDSERQRIQYLVSRSTINHPSNIIVWFGLLRQGFIQDFSTGGGGVQHQCHCAATHVTRGGGGGYASTDLIGSVGSGVLPIMHCAPNIENQNRCLKSSAL